MKEAAVGPKGIKLFLNDALEESFKELNCMFSADTLLNYLGWLIPLAVHTDASDKQVGDVVS